MHFIGMSADLPIGEHLTCTVSDACAFAGIGKTKLYELINGGASATTSRQMQIDYCFVSQSDAWWWGTRFLRENFLIAFESQKNPSWFCSKVLKRKAEQVPPFC